MTNLNNCTTEDLESILEHQDSIQQKVTHNLTSRAQKFCKEAQKLVEQYEQARPHSEQEVNSQSNTIYHAIAQLLPDEVQQEMQPHWYHIFLPWCRTTLKEAVHNAVNNVYTQLEASSVELRIEKACAQKEYQKVHKRTADLCADAERFEAKYTAGTREEAYFKREREALKKQKQEYFANTDDAQQRAVDILLNHTIETAAVIEKELSTLELEQERLKEYADTCESERKQARQHRDAARAYYNHTSLKYSDIERTKAEFGRMIDRLKAGDKRLEKILITAEPLAEKADAVVDEWKRVQRY